MVNSLSLTKAQSCQVLGVTQDAKPVDIHEAFVRSRTECNIGTYRRALGHGNSMQQIGTAYLVLTGQLSAATPV